MHITSSSLGSECITMWFGLQLASGPEGSYNGIYSHALYVLLAINITLFMHAMIMNMHACNNHL